MTWRRWEEVVETRKYEVEKEKMCNRKKNRKLKKTEREENGKRMKREEKA